LVNERLIECLAAESISEAEPKLGHHEQHILVEHVDDKVWIASIVFPTMIKEQRNQIRKLADGIVWGAGCLLAFKTADANADMCRSYHIDIVSTVTNR